MSLPKGEFAIKMGKFQKFVGLMAKEWIVKEASSDPNRPETKNIQLIVFSPGKFEQKFQINYRTAENIKDFAVYGKLLGYKERQVNREFGRAVKSIKAETIDLHKFPLRD